MRLLRSTRIMLTAVNFSPTSTRKPAKSRPNAFLVVTHGKTTAARRVLPMTPRVRITGARQLQPGLVDQSRRAERGAGVAVARGRGQPAQLLIGHAEHVAEFPPFFRGPFHRSLSNSGPIRRFGEV